MKTMLAALAKDLAAAKKKREAIAANMMAQLLRPDQTKIRCSARVIESVMPTSAAPADAGRQPADFRVVLITEGMGNSADKHYYGPEAIDSVPSAFEGRPCFLDHPSNFEDKDIPERRVEAKCGYFRNVQVQMIEGERAGVAELVLDTSESGYTARAKLQTALRYRQEFPGFDSEYVGLSINASGAWERRKVDLDGKQVEVKYVTKFTRGGSCDIVTDPARGGRVLAALVESAAGAIRRKEGAPMMEKLKKMLEAARASLKEAMTETDPEKAKAKIALADQSMESFVQEASAGADTAAEEAAKAAKAKEDDAEEAAKAAAAADAKKADKKDEDEDDAVESRKLAIKGLLIEAGLHDDADVAKAVEALPLKEAKSQIEFLKKFSESRVRKAVKTMQVPAAHFSKLSESERKEASAVNNNKFAGCNR